MTNTPARPGTAPVTTLRISTATPSPTPDADLQVHFDDIRELARRIDDRDPRTPPWAWTNLTSQETLWSETAVDGFVADYNRTHVVIIEDVIPACWRHHPALAHELLVQFWSWWHCHLNPKSTINAADDYYEKTLPLFQTRLAKRLLGRSAVNCRRGTHTATADPELTQAVRAAYARPTTQPDPGASPIRQLRIMTFGSGEPGVV